MNVLRILTRLSPYVDRATCSTTKAAHTTLNKYLSNCRRLQTTATKYDMNEFFDLENFDSEKVNAGRPWRTDELRLKSSGDLHKLWYVLLKERNMLLTMQEMYEEAGEPFVSPERTFKVEESMENILKVIKERNIAVDMVERGDSDEITKTKYARNVFGFPVETNILEHHKPKHESVRSKKMFMEYKPWMDKYQSLYEEKLRLAKNREYKRYKRYQKRVMTELNVKEEDIPEFEPSEKLENYLKKLTMLNDHGQRK